MTDNRKNTISPSKTGAEFIKENDFILQAIKFADAYLSGILNSYTADGMIKKDHPGLQLLSTFYTLQREEIYHEVEGKLIIAFKKIAKISRKYLNAYWRSVMGVLSFMIGITLVAQNNRNEAQFYLDLSTINSGYLGIEFIAHLTNAYLCLTDENHRNTIMRAEWHHKLAEMKLKEFQIVSNDTSISNYLFDECDKKLKSYSNEIDEDCFAVLDLSAQLEEWKQKKCGKGSKIIQTKILHSKYFFYLAHKNYVDTLSFLSNVIINQLNECLLTKGKPQVFLTKQYQTIANTILETVNYLKFNSFITHMMLEIGKKKSAAKLCGELKIVLEHLLRNVQANDALFCYFCGDNDIRYFIARLTTEQIRVPFKLGLSTEEVLGKTKVLNKNFLEVACNTVKIKKTECDELLKHFFTNKPDYHDLHAKCANLIDALNKDNSCLKIYEIYGPILVILYYIKTVCAMVLGKDTRVIEMNLYVALYQPEIPPEIQNLLFLTRAFVRLQGKWIDDGEEDLKKITNDSAFINLKKILNNAIIDYRKNNPTLNIQVNETIKELLNKLKTAVLAGDYQEAIRLQKKYEKYDQTKIHGIHQVEYHFWLTILFFELRNHALFPRVNRYDESLFPHLEGALNATHDLIMIFLRFLETIATQCKTNEPVLPYITLFYTDFKKLMNITDHQAWFDSLVFDPAVFEHCKKVIEKYNQIMIENEKANLLAASVDTPIKTVKPQKNLNSNRYRKWDARKLNKELELQNKINHNTSAIDSLQKQLTLNTSQKIILEQEFQVLEKKLKSLEIIAAKEKININTSETLLKNELNEINEAIQLSDETIRKINEALPRAHELEIRKINFFRRFFFEKEDIKLVVSLHHLAKSYHRSLDFKGTMVFIGYLELLKKVNPGTLPLNDADAAIDCGGIKREVIRAKLISSEFGFSIKKENRKYINLKKQLKSGLEFDLTLQFIPSHTRDPFPFTRGIAFLDLYHGEDSPTLSVDTLNVYFNSFHDAANLLETKIDLPHKRFTNFTFRLWKYTKRFGDLIKMINLLEVTNALYPYYVTSLTKKKNTVYLEIISFVSNNALQNPLAFSYLKRVFTAIFEMMEINPNVKISIDEFMQLFIFYKNTLDCDHKNIFKFQVINLIIYYLQCREYEYLLSISQPQPTIFSHQAVLPTPKYPLPLEVDTSSDIYPPQEMQKPLPLSSSSSSREIEGSRFRHFYLPKNNLALQVSQETLPDKEIEIMPSIQYKPGYG